MSTTVPNSTEQPCRGTAYPTARQIITLLVCLFMALAPAACSSEDDTSKDAADTAAVQEPSTGVTGNGEDSPSSPDESANTSKDGASSEVLTKAREQGGVSVTQYEQAWSRYKQCMTDLGYKNVILDHLPNGLYQRVMSDTIPDQAKYDKAMRDDDDCYDDIAVIAQVYNAQIGNVHILHRYRRGLHRLSAPQQPGTHLIHRRPVQRGTSFTATELQP